jgi:glutamate dehydrogenase
VNSMVNRVGPSFVHRLGEETGAAAPDIVRAYLGTRQVFDLVSLWEANDALDHIIDMPAQHGIVRASVRLLERGTVWLLHEREALRDLGATITRFEAGVAEVGAGLPRWMVPGELEAIDAEAAALATKGVPAELAARVARLDAQAAGLDIVEVAAELSLPIDAVAAAYFGVGGRLGLGWLQQQIAALPADSRWLALARLAMRNDLTALARELARSVLKGAGTVDGWESQRSFKLGRARQLEADLKLAPSLDMPMLSVLLRELRALV